MKFHLKRRRRFVSVYTPFYIHDQTSPKWEAKRSEKGDGVLSGIPRIVK